MDIAVLGIKALPATAGADRVVEKLLESFSPENHYWVYVRSDDGRQARCHDHLHFVHIPALRGKHLGSFSYFLLCCVHYLLKGRYDLAHVHNSDFGLFLPLLRLRRGVPVLATFHGDPYTRQKWGRLARLFLRVSELFFVSFAHRLTSVSRFKARARGLWGSRSVEYVPNGVDPYWEIAAKESFPLQEHGLEQDGYVLFAAGRLDPTKGLHHLLTAYRGMERPERLLVVADFQHDMAYAQRVGRMLQEEPRAVTLRHLLPRAQLLAAVSGSKVFVFPSEVEAMSMMLLEVVSCKQLVVCSDIPENVEIVGEDYPYLFRSGDAEELRSRLMAALQGAPETELVDRLYARCMERFRWSTIARAYERCYRELVGEGPAEPKVVST